MHDLEYLRSVTKTMDFIINLPMSPWILLHCVPQIHSVHIPKLETIAMCPFFKGTADEQADNLAVKGAG